MDAYRWCSTCSADEVFERPLGESSPEAFCTACGDAVFLWLDSVLAVAVELEAAA